MTLLIINIFLGHPMGSISEDAIIFFFNSNFVVEFNIEKRRSHIEKIILVKKL